MSSEPNKSMDQLLKAFAEKRRQDGGDPPELHPASRRILQSAVTREYGDGGASGKMWSRWFVTWLPRLAGAAVILACLGILGWVLFQPHGVRKESDFARLSRSAEAAPSTPTDRREVVSQPPSPRAPSMADKTRGDGPRGAAPSEAPGTDNVVTGFRPKQYGQVPDTGVPHGAKGLASLAPLAEPPAAERPLAPAAPGVSVATKPQAPIKPAPTGGRDVAMKPSSTSARPEALALAVERKMDSQALVDSKLSGVGGAPVRGGQPGSLPEIIGNRAVAKAQPSRNVAPAKSATSPFTEQANFTNKDLAREAVSDAIAPARLAVRDKRADTGLSTENAPVATSAVPVSALRPPPGETFTRLQSLTQQASPTAEGIAAKEASGPTQRLYFRRTLPTNAKAAGGLAPGDESIPLTSFSWQQNGRQLQVVDHDGSVYSGEWRGVPPGAVANQPSDNTARFSKASSIQQGAFRAVLQAGQTAGTFRVLGTNRTLKQRVLFEGSLLRQTATAVTRPEMGRGGNAYSKGARPTPTFAFEAKPTPSTNPAVSEAKRFSGSLRIQAKATLGDGRVLPIDAVGNRIGRGE